MLISLEPLRKASVYQLLVNRRPQSTEIDSYTAPLVNRQAVMEIQQIHIQKVDRRTIYTDLNMEFEEDKLRRRDPENTEIGIEGKGMSER